MSPTSLTIWGLGLSALGTVLLFLFGLPGLLSPYPKHFNFFGGGTTAKEMDYRRRASNWGSGFAVTLILIGDLLQALAVK